MPRNEFQGFSGTLHGNTAALTMNVAGVVKDWLLIAFSWSVIRNTVTTINLTGYGVAFWVFVINYYNAAKLKALKAKETQKQPQQTDEESGKLLEERGEKSEQA